ncbi:hypothetical protein KD050_18550 [Psychrobacillus sp. INOP01]|uniref:hypothetical protein n=1 Tax=Psychrobacillus sp. INOP01 TaxID=2829187 RepID=UPI001BA43FD9|nr:hypothetical protein [Psychrobacillus sp. INOP01]QUG41254.1 hypothetical protein KD050_18550 [Psychrobacillus sp. INOP01]
MNKIHYQVIFRNENKIFDLQDITELKVEGGVYLFYSGSYVCYSVPIDLVKEIISS